MNNSRRIALVTGGAGGIGAELCRQLALDGCQIIVADLDQGAVNAVASMLPGKGHVGLELDVGDEASVDQAFAKAEQTIGAVHVLVHAAGIMLTEPDRKLLRFWESGVARWDETMAVNARGTYLMAAAYMKKGIAAPIDNGRIILFSSLAGQNGGSRPYADYAASKAAVLGFMRAAARECAPFGITVNAVAPGLIETPMMRRNIAVDVPVNKDLIVVGRYGQPSDIAAAVRYLASPSASFITGATIDVNGGQAMR